MLLSTATYKVQDNIQGKGSVRGRRSCLSTPSAQLLPLFVLLGLLQLALLLLLPTITAVSTSTTIAGAGAAGTTTVVVN